ncbi:MAG: lamin tail domain-containing protein [Chitinispirillaceae bacterium]|nr:lamin tail domain-containing protein [Chitinispirillaceae bacterium]
MHHALYKITTGLTCLLLSATACYRYSGEIDPELFNLRITEIHYHPLPSDGFPGDSLEFIELKNTGSKTVDLSTCSFTDGISFVFPRGAHADAGGFYVIASSRDGFRKRYGFAPDGIFTGRLGNNEDTIVLTDDYTEQEVLMQMYADSGDWPEEADGQGYSLVPVETSPPRNPTGPWRCSVKTHGSPGADDIPEAVDLALYNLRITEIHYHPLDPDSLGGDSLEFIELKNTGTKELPLGEIAFTSGITCTFDEDATLDAGAFFVIASSRNGFLERYGREPDGVYTGKLGNSGEMLIIRIPASAKVLMTLSYLDRIPWPEAPDGDGYSLVPVSTNPPENQNYPELWRQSFAVNGSPFADDPGIVIVNEVVSNAVGGDAIELFNPGDDPVDIGGWFLTDRASDPMRFVIPTGTVLPAGGYHYFTEDDFNNAGASALKPFSLSSHGDDVYVMATADGCDGGYCHGFSFGPLEPDRSIGRYITSKGKEVFVPQRAITLGEKNEGPLIGPLIISEIMFQSSGNRSDYLEITNIDLQQVRLYDPDHPENTWKIDGIGFSFPEGTSIKSGESVIIASDSLTEEEFRSRYEVDDDVQMFLMSTTLPKEEFSVTLQKPGEPYIEDSLVSTVPTVPYLYVDGIMYGGLTWLYDTNGPGISIHRSRNTFGDDPASWRSDDPDPGTTGKDQF